ncbi:transcriptional regulator [Acuticoccus sediminis]|uniref:Transcriptional regulator n=1 Tax=Acuticoccus sediminis TaxID=2184697 RepID=A0A8B2NRH8_9HYPH|nr:helix-turn-helix transcriptional regulator [Acuticoccus sediminis]RAI02486.1 transcriptional regulator [Acuticoccus sediminis]
MENGEYARLGQFLTDRRNEVDPQTLGYCSPQRPGPGLRREEVAERAHVSVAWYTCLEQGQEKPPPVDVLDRLSHALMLTKSEHDRLHTIAYGRSHSAKLRQRMDAGARLWTPPPTDRLKHALDSLQLCPAYIRSPAWDVLAWNRAAREVMGDYATLAPERRNVLRILFCEPIARVKLKNWEMVARNAVQTFRMEKEQYGMPDAARRLVDDLMVESPMFAEMWCESGVNNLGEGTRVFDDPELGLILLDYATYNVDEQPGMGLVVFTPATSGDGERLHTLLSIRSKVAASHYAHFHAAKHS